jgi:hypothetical protein
MNEYYIKFEMKGKFSIQTDVWQYNRVSEVTDCCLAPTQDTILIASQPGFALSPKRCVA